MKWTHKTICVIVHLCRIWCPSFKRFFTSPFFHYALLLLLLKNLIMAFLGNSFKLKWLFCDFFSPRQLSLHLLHCSVFPFCHFSFLSFLLLECQTLRNSFKKYCDKQQTCLQFWLLLLLHFNLVKRLISHLLFLVSSADGKTELSIKKTNQQPLGPLYNKMKWKFHIPNFKIFSFLFV